jgi:hypothetical protein
MCELQQRSAAGSKEERGLTINAPGDRPCAEDALDGFIHVLFRGSDQAIEIAVRNGRGSFSINGRRHQP